MDELFEIIDQFSSSDVDGASTLKLPPMSFEQRKIIHEYVEKLGLYTYSTGGGAERYITVTKQASAYSPKECDVKMFIRDFQLPIPIHKSPYFMYFINLYQLTDLYKMFVDSIRLTQSKYGNGLKQYAFCLQKEIVGAIRDTPGYQRLTKDTKWLAKDNRQSIPEAHIYKDTSNSTKYYISIDMIKANYNAMRMYDPSIFKGSSTWEEYMATFTTIPYFIKSKYFRQIIFGNLSLKNFWRKYLDIIYSLLKSNYNVLGKIADDELIIEVDDPTMIHKYTNRIKEIVEEHEESKHMWRITPFSLCPFEGSQDVFIKHNYLSSSDEIKNCDKDLHAQYYKKHFKLLTHPYDFKALKNELVITYEPIF